MRFSPTANLLGLFIRRTYLSPERLFTNHPRPTNAPLAKTNKISQTILLSHMLMEAQFFPSLSLLAPQQGILLYKTLGVAPY